MLFLPLLVGLDLAPFSWGDPDERIINGVTISIADAPFSAALFKDNSFYCTAVIGSNDTIFTAAHCVTSLSSYTQMTVRVGSASRTSGGQLLSLGGFVYNPSFSGNDLVNGYDIAALKLASPITDTAAVKATFATVAPTQGTIVYDAGWGATNTDGTGIAADLQRATLEAFPNDCPNTRIICLGAVGSATAANGGQDTCSGDSGGPAYYKDGTVFGLVSAGSRPCADGTLTGYTSVIDQKSFITSYLLDWNCAVSSVTVAAGTSTCTFTTCDSPLVAQYCCIITNGDGTEFGRQCASPAARATTQSINVGGAPTGTATGSVYWLASSTTSGSTNYGASGTTSSTPSSSSPAPESDSGTVAVAVAVPVAASIGVFLLCIIVSFCIMCCTRRKKSRAMRIDCPQPGGPAVLAPPPQIYSSQADPYGAAFTQLYTGYY